MIENGHFLEMTNNLEQTKCHVVWHEYGMCWLNSGCLNTAFCTLRHLSCWLIIHDNPFNCRNSASSLFLIQVEKAFDGNFQNTVQQQPQLRPLCVQLFKSYSSTSIYGLCFRQRLPRPPVPRWRNKPSTKEINFFPWQNFSVRHTLT